MTVRLPIRPSVKLNIHNQCSNFDLVSPAYITHDRSECYRTPGHKVYAGDTMKSGFIIKSNDVVDGALIYKLQRRQSHESTEIGDDISSAAQLLVVWRISEFKKLYADVLLVEHDERLDWNKYKLGKLYRENIDQFKLYPVPVIETWLLDDNTALMTTFKIMDGGQLLNITISEVEEANYERTPAYIDLER
jgi:hypothetical protein